MLSYLHVCKADNGETSVYDSRDKFVAGFVDGKWLLDHMFSFYDMEERLSLVQDDQEALQILDEARLALNKPLKDPADNRAKSA